MLRPATLSDVPMLARIHVQAWQETYAGLLPPDEIARRTHDIRAEQWIGQFAIGTSRVILIPDLGFAQFGPQREDPKLAVDYPDQLYALYLLKAGQGRGLGRALFEAVRGPLGFTAFVLDGNGRACRFYERMGGHHIDTRDEESGETTRRERVYGWSAI